MNYFRADAQLIAKMVAKECLRYSTDNVASLLTVFDFPAKGGKTYHLVVRFVGEDAETMNRQGKENNWYEIKGRLLDSTPLYEPYELPSLSIRATSYAEIPAASKSGIQVSLIGRLTYNPEHIVKNENFEFSRFSLAINRADSDKASFFNVSVFKPTLMQEVTDSVKKGDSVFISGQLTFFEAGQEHHPKCAIKLDYMNPLKN